MDWDLRTRVLSGALAQRACKPLLGTFFGLGLLGLGSQDLVPGVLSGLLNRIWVLGALLRIGPDLGRVLRTWVLGGSPCSGPGS